MPLVSHFFKTFGLQFRSSPPCCSSSSRAPLLHGLPNLRTGECHLSTFWLHKKCSSAYSVVSAISGSSGLGEMLLELCPRICQAGVYRTTSRCRVFATLLIRSSPEHFYFHPSCQPATENVFIQKEMCTYMKVYVYMYKGLCIYIYIYVYMHVYIHKQIVGL